MLLPRSDNQRQYILWSKSQIKKKNLCFINIILFTSLLCQKWKGCKFMIIDRDAKSHYKLNNFL